MKQLSALAVLACLTPGLAAAQDADAGGMLLSFGLNQRFELTDGGGRDSTTRLSFGFSDTTRSERLALQLGTGLQISRDTGAEVLDPSARLSYRREGADAALTASAGWSRTDLGGINDLTDLRDADGNIVLPDDLDALGDAGTRTVRSQRIGLEWGTAAPVGYRIDAGRRSLTYTDAGAGLTDAETTTLGAGIRLDLSPVLTGRADIDHSRYDPADGPPEDTTRFALGLVLDRPTGDVSTRLTATRADDGDLSWGVSLGGRTTGPGRSLSGSIGITQDSQGDPRLTGQLAYRQDLPEGAISLRGQRSISTGGASDGRRDTTLQASYSQRLSPLANLQLGFDYARAEETDGTADLADASLSASYGLRLTPDWQLSLGARAGLRDDDGTRSRANSLFVVLDRSFDWRP